MDDVKRFCALLSARLEAGGWGDIDSSWFQYISGEYPREELDNLERRAVDKLEKVIAGTLADFTEVTDSSQPATPEESEGG